MRHHDKSGLFWLACLLCIVGCGHDSTPLLQRLSGTQIADRATPATVRVIVQIQATTQVPKPSIDMDSLHTAADPLASYQDSPQDRFRRLVNILLSDPARFLVASSNMRTAQTSIHGQGSGVIFTPDGYVATNAHVVKPDDDEIKEAMVQSIKQWVESDVADLEQAIRQVLPSAHMTEEAQSKLIEVLANYYATNARVSGISPTVYSIMGYTKNDADIELVGARCEIKRVGEPVPGKDVANLKMEGDNFPTLPLASSLASTGLRTGADIYVVGFPGAITLSTDLKLPSRLEPSQTAGHVSAIKDMEGGWQVIQTDTAINPGNSGGPALNDQGQVVGLATFKLRGQEGINFIVSVDLLQEFIHDLNVRPSRSRFTQKYLQALDSYEHNRSGRALTLFRELSSERPGVRSVETFIQLLDSKGGGKGVIPVSDSVVVQKLDSHVSPASQRQTKALLTFGLIAGALFIIILIVVMANRS